MPLSDLAVFLALITYYKITSKEIILMFQTFDFFSSKEHSLLRPVFTKHILVFWYY